MGAFWLLLIAATVALIVWAVRRGSGAHSGPASRGAESAEDPALSVLNERYARGELDATEYWERRRMLEGTPGSGVPT
jgi:putative membrane protein